MEKNELSEYEKLFDTNVESLHGILRHFRTILPKNEKKKLKKGITLELFIKWMEHQRKVKTKNMFEILKINWNRHKVSQSFIESANKFENLEEIVKGIITILMGNFSNVSQVHMYSEKKIAGIFSYSIDDLNKILFAIYFESIERKGEDKPIAQELIKFLAVWNSKIFSNCSEVKDEFIEKFSSNSEKYPNIEFDQTGLIKRSSEIFFNRSLFINTRKRGKIQLYCPHLTITCQSKPFLMKFRNKPVKGFDLESFQLNETNQMTLYAIQNNPLHVFVDKLLDENRFNIVLSLQEKFLIRTKFSFLMTGRPGTGKTTVILMKLFATFLNFQIRKSLYMCNEIDWKYIKENMNHNQLSNQFKVVMTTLSFDLCKKIQEMYKAMITKSEMDIIYNPLEEDTVKNLNSFRELRNYPFFINFRKLMFMIDGSLNFQFFRRFSNLVKYDSSCDFKFNDQIKYECNRYDYPPLDFDKVSFFLRSPSLVDNDPEVKIEINEDNFEVFFSLNLTKNLKQSALDNKLQASEIYSQIHSVIKGSLLSHLSPLNCLTREEYHKKGSKLTDWDEDRRNLIYDICIEYEKWKRKRNVVLFDIQDVVNHLIRQVKIEMYSRNLFLIDYLFIDEIQDLTISQIYLLVLVSRCVKAYAGDTCQTISKTNRFRFADLKNIFYVFSQIIPDYKEPEYAPLTLNFRFNTKIHKLGNFISHLIMKLFPHTLDKYKEDFTTKVSSTLPTVLPSLGIISQRMINTNNTFVNNFIFSCYHCFICRDEVSANILRKNLNVFSSYIGAIKGLEYEIVIIYNFFKDSKLRNIWTGLLKNLVFINQNFESIADVEKLLRKENKSETELRSIIEEHNSFIYPILKKDYNVHEIFEFCTELKELYVAITRARSFLLFFDEDIEVFPEFCSLLASNGLLEYLNYQVDFFEYMNEYLRDLSMKKMTQEDLIKQGYVYFDSHNYREAEYFFRNGGDSYMAALSIIHEKYESINNLKGRRELHQTTFWNLNHELIELIEDISYKFTDPEGIKGECYLNIGEIEKALSYFNTIRNFKKCGILCLEQLQRYKEAFDYFNRINDVSLAIKALIRDNNYEKLFQYIFEKSSHLDYSSFTYYYFRYACDYLNSLILPKKSKQIITSFFKEKPNEETNFIRMQVLNEFTNRYGHPLTFDYVLSGRLKLEYFNMKLYQPKKTYLYFSSLDFPDYLNHELDLSKETQLNPTRFELLFNFFFKYFQTLWKKGIHDKDIIYFLNQHKQIFTTANADYNVMSEYTRKEVPLLSMTHQATKSNCIYPVLDDISQDAIRKTLADFNATDKIKDLISAHLFKNHLKLYRFLLENSPYLYYIKSSLFKQFNYISSLFGNKRGKQLKQMTQKEILNLKKLTNKIGMDDKELKKMIMNLLLYHGYYDFLTLLFSDELKMFVSAVLKKYMLFHKMLISFDKFSFAEVSERHLFLFSSFLQINIMRYLKFFKKGQKDNKILIAEKHLKPYPKISSLLSDFSERNYLTKACQSSIIEYIHKFTELLSLNNISLNSSCYEFIEIGTTISLFFFLYGSKSFNWTLHSIYNIMETRKLTEVISQFIDEITGLLIQLRKVSSSQYGNLSDSKALCARYVLFSLFSILGISLLPNIQELTPFKNIPIAMLHIESPIFWEGEIISDKTNDQVSYLNKKVFAIFDSGGKNLVISYKTAFKIFHTYSSSFCRKLYDLSCDYLLYPKDILSEEANLTYSILYYFIAFMFECIKNLSQFKNSYGKVLSSYFSTFIYHDRFSALDPFSVNEFKNKGINFAGLVLNLSKLPIGSEVGKSMDKQSLVNIMKIILILSLGSADQTSDVTVNIALMLLLFSEYMDNNTFSTIKTLLHLSDDHKYVWDLSTLLNKGDLLEFYLSLINFLSAKNTLEVIATELLLVWIKKLYPIIQYILSYLTNTEFQYYSDDYSNAMDFTKLKLDNKKLNSKDIAKSINKYFVILKYFMENYLYDEGLNSWDIQLLTQRQQCKIIQKKRKNIERKFNFRIRQSYHINRRNTIGQCFRKKRNYFRLENKIVRRLETASSQKPHQNWLLNYFEYEMFKVYLSINGFLNSIIDKSSKKIERILFEAFEYIEAYERFSSYYLYHHGRKNCLKISSITEFSIPHNEKMYHYPHFLFEHQEMHPDSITLKKELLFECTKPSGKNILRQDISEIKSISDIPRDYFFRIKSNIMDKTLNEFLFHKINNDEAYFKLFDYVILKYPIIK